MIPIEREDRDNITILKPQPQSRELDFENTVQLRSELHSLLKERKNCIIIDMTDVDAISSYTVGVFVAFAKDLRERKGDLKFVNVHGRTHDTFYATRINHILNLFDGDNAVDKAIKAFI